MLRNDQATPVPFEHCAGIRSMKCTACSFEFVYVTPEETDNANLVMALHLHEMHGANSLTVAVEITQY